MGAARARHESSARAPKTAREGACAPLSSSATDTLPRSAVYFRHWWGKEKRAELLASLDKETSYEHLRPSLPLGLPFVLVAVRVDFHLWPLLTELLAVSFPGVKTSRDAAVVEFDRETLELRLSHYLDANVSHTEMRDRCPEIMEISRTFKAEVVRDRLRARGRKFVRIVRYAYKPLDHRWLA